jgi:hypothetical protein
MTTGQRAAVAGSSAALVNVSYGGVCLEMPRLPGAGLPPHFQLDLPSADTSVTARPIWVSSGPSGPFRVGAELIAEDERGRRWRALVDKMN